MPCIVELKAGQRGPAFQLENFAGGHASLDAWRDYRAGGLVVVGISVDRGAPRPLLEPYLRHLGLTFPILLDADGRTSGAWRVTGLPATFLVKPGSDVAGFAIGAREWNSREMRALLETMLPRRRRTPRAARPEDPQSPDRPTTRVRPVPLSRRGKTGRPRVCRLAGTGLCHKQDCSYNFG